MVKTATIPQAEVEEDVREEYASVTLSLDHLLTDDTHGHTVLKNVWSTESAVESLLAQIDYFGESALLRDPGTLSMIAKGNEDAAVFVYTVNEALTNVIVDAAIWTDVVAREGTVLAAHASLIALAADMKRASAAAGKADRILAFISA